MNQDNSVRCGKHLLGVEAFCIPNWNVLCVLRWNDVDGLGKIRGYRGDGWDLADGDQRQIQVARFLEDAVERHLIG